MRAYLHLIGVVCWTLFGVLASPAEARRVALVIGNADYKSGPLQNPVSDADAVAEAFERKLGFDKVILKKNLTFNGFRGALDELAREAAGSDIAVVYFAGHGMEVSGKNFLIPVDARLARPGALDLEAIPLDTVLGQLEGVRELKLVILDACRDNPFLLRGGKRSAGRGLARIEPEDSTLVVYAAKDGTTADDGVGRRHSPFTQALLKHIETPDVEVRILLGRVGDDVKTATGHQQQPHLYGNLGGKEFYLRPKTPAPASFSEKPAPPIAPQLSEAERAWALVKDNASIEVIEAFRKQYGAANALYDRLAAERIDTLKSGAASWKLAAAPAKEPAPPVPSAPPDLARLLQTELKRVGCDPGSIDGKWGDKGEAALARFARHAKLALQTEAPTADALAALKGQQARVCPLECGSDAVERDGACVAKAPPPPRERPGVKAVTVPKARAAPAPPTKRVQRPQQDGPKSGMCWAIEVRSNTLVPCSDPRAGPKAY
jgi:uncharacterized caspase-like protein